MEDERLLLESFAKAIKKRYVEALEQVSTTGKSIKSIETVVTDRSVTLEAGYWFRHIDYGRPPARTDPGNEEFRQNLKNWIIKKESFELTHNQSLPRATNRLAWLINTYGTKNFGQSRAILESVDITQDEQRLAKDLGKLWLTRITNGISNRAKFDFVKVKIGRV